MLLLGAGPRALLLQLAHPLVAAGVGRPLRFPGRPVAPAGGDVAQLPDDRVRLDRRGPGRDPAPQHAPSRDHADRATRRATPSSRLWVHATLIDSTIAVADAWLEPLSAAPPGGVLRRDSTDRPGVRRARRDAPGRPRGVRALRGGHARRRPDPCASRRSHASWRGSSCDRRSGRSRHGWRRCPADGLRLDAVAVGRPAAGVACATTTAWPGVRASDSSRPGSWPAGGPGARSCPASFRQMPQALAADRRMGGGPASVSRGKRGSNSAGRGRAASPRRACRAASSSVASSNAMWRRGSRAAPPRTRSSPSAGGCRRAGCRPGCRCPRSSRPPSTGRSSGRAGRSSSG